MSNKSRIYELIAVIVGLSAFAGLCWLSLGLAIVMRYDNPLVSQTIIDAMIQLSLIAGGGAMVSGIVIGIFATMVMSSRPEDVSPTPLPSRGIPINFPGGGKGIIVIDDAGVGGFDEDVDT